MEKRNSKCIIKIVNKVILIWCSPFICECNCKCILELDSMNWEEIYEKKIIASNKMYSV